jgi:putative Holliday junction resolvase
MRSLGLDVGDRRTGVAISDSEGILAVPLAVIDNRDEDATINAILKFVQQYEVERIVVGLPYSLNGNSGQQVNKVVDFTGKLQNVIASGAKQSHFTRVDIQMWDERLSTVAAEKLMREAGTKKNKRKQNRDAIAAAFILQGFLDSCHSEQSEESS